MFQNSFPYMNITRKKISTSHYPFPYPPPPPKKTNIRISVYEFLCMLLTVGDERFAQKIALISGFYLINENQSSEIQSINANMSISLSHDDEYPPILGGI